jgi:hypothetical protein
MAHQHACSSPAKVIGLIEQRHVLPYLAQENIGHQESAMEFYDVTAKEKMWETLSFENVPIPASLAIYRQLLSSEYSNGRVDAMCLKGSGGQELFALMNSSNWTYSYLLQRLWSKPLVQAVIGDVGKDPDDAHFMSVDKFGLVATLARWLNHGGAYSRPGNVSFEKSFKLTLDVVRDTVTGDGDLLLISESAWCPYFRDIAWDVTCLAISQPYQTITIVMATDED